MTDQDYYDLGRHGRPVSTANADAQQWFNRGLVWLYAFDLEQGQRCFQRAIALDADCAMHYWGLAYASGCYYNQPWRRMQQDELARKLANSYDAVQVALDHLDGASPVEAALVNALTARYQSRTPVAEAQYHRWDDDYALAMGRVYDAHPHDNDVCALYAEALMCRTPWMLWDLRSGKPAAGASTEQAVAVLETAMARLERAGDAPHPGILHMYLHVMEMSPFPERALRACDALRQLVPGSGHLCHMPSHIDVRCGHYHDAVAANDNAIAADREYLRREGALNFHTLSRIHNFHLKIYAALFLGQYRAAREAAEELIATTPEALLRIESPAMADWMEGYIGMKAHVFIRFGKWAEIMAEPLPADPQLYCMTTALWHYAKTIACAAGDDVPAAAAQRRQFERAAANVPASRYLFNNTCSDILQIAEQMMNGEIAYRQRHYEQAFAHLRRAVYLDDNLKYDEPWGWMQPARHALGALLLEQGLVAQAEQVYRADLGLDDTLVSTSQHHDNLWSLHGYVECLHKLGRVTEAGQMSKRLSLAAARADVAVNASCYCRLDAMVPGPKSAVGQAAMPAAGTTEDG